MRDYISPSRQLMGFTLLVLLLAAYITWLSVHTPWFGMQLTGGLNQPILLQEYQGKTDLQGHTLPLEVMAIRIGSDLFELLETDIIEEPDVFDSYETLNTFLARQQLLAEQVQSKELTLVLRPKEQQEQPFEVTIRAQDSRPITTLPADFWIQILTGIGSFVIGCWVLVLRPKDSAAHCFTLTGVALMMSAFPAAVYSSRELAVPIDTFQWLISFNHFGGVGFGFALLALFLIFPKPLIRSSWLLVLALIYGLWLIGEQLQLANAPQDMMYIPILLLSVLIMLTIGIQWWHSRKDPSAKAALRWLGLATVLTISIFVVLAAIPSLFNLQPVVSQGTSFGFFLIMYAGLAMGLRRSRLFDLDRWAFHVLLWVLAGLALVGLDLVFITLLNWQQQTSLMASLVICGFMYLPIRGWLWRRLVERSKPDSRSLFNNIVEISLAPSKAQYQQRWLAMLSSLFQPLHISSANQGVSVLLHPNGLTLYVPPILHSEGVLMHMAENGKRLFRPQDVELLEEIIDMLSYANDNRTAWQQGAEEERKRIAQDLHDDLGSRLLTGLHQSKSPVVRDTIGLALSDMRSIVRGLAGQSLPLEQALSELRKEGFTRCESANIKLDWPVLLLNEPFDLNYNTYRHLLSLVREIFSNMIRHSQATQVQVYLSVKDGWFDFQVQDNGISFDGTTLPEEQTGLGLSNLKKRANLLNGELKFIPQQQGTLIHLSVALNQA